MKPKNRKQQDVDRVSGYLSGLTLEQREWAQFNCFSPEAYRRKTGDITCSMCGHQWNNKQNNSEADVTCPHCKSELSIIESKKRTVDQISYMTIADVVENYQVLRNFMVHKQFRFGEKVNVQITEVVQTWFDEAGNCVPIAKKRLMCSYNCRQPFSIGSEMDFRSRIINEYMIWGDVYPQISVTNKLVKRGLTSFCGCNPYHLVRQLLSDDSKAENLIKTGQYDLLIAYTSTSSDRDVIRYWNQIRIATRHKYKVDDPVMWLDYLAMLAFEHKDLNNPHFICPGNLKEAHDKYMRIKRNREAKQQRQRRQQELLKRENESKEFEKRIRKYLDLRFTDENIEIVPLSSLEEIMQEGDMMKHCVFVNKYYAKSDSLILSARIGEEHLETVEVDLKSWRVVQSRGVCNQTTPYHDQIVNLVNRNINLIKRIA